MAGGPEITFSAWPDMLGYVGGGILAICMIPQVWKMVRTLSADDLSLPMTLLYTLGLLLTMVYLIIVNATAAWIPIAFESLVAVIMVALKLWLDVRAKRKAKVEAGPGAAPQPRHRPSLDIPPLLPVTSHWEGQGGAENGAALHPAAARD